MNHPGGLYRVSTLFEACRHFGGGGSSAPAPPPVVPTADPAQVAQQQQAAEQQRIAAQGGGNASTILTGSPMGDAGDPNNSAAKKLLGSFGSST